MLSDSATIHGPSDAVVENVTKLPTSPQSYRIVYLTTTDGSFVPGLYIFSALGIWTLMNDSGEVS